MSDQLVAEALRSDAPLVLVEAPAGCGKTFQAAQYAKDLLPVLFPGRLLVLTHTNAACDVFAARISGFGGRVEIRTIDSLIARIATAYHKALGLPPDVATWAHQRGPSGFNEIAVRVAGLLELAPAISASVATRYPFIICDEHQDSSEAQHRIILSIHHAGSFARIFGDPMQAIYSGRRDRDAWDRRWAELRAAADKCVELEIPHRWKQHASELGDWISEARGTLKAGREIDLRRELPSGLALIYADNIAQRYGQYMVCADERRPIDRFVRSAPELLVLTSTNDMVRGLRAFFYRRIPIWEGHTRESLAELVLSCREHSGDVDAIADAFIGFVQSVATGFSNTSYANTLRREVAERCSSHRRQKSARIQEIARSLIESPDHRGVARAIQQLSKFLAIDNSSSDIRIDLTREYNDAARLAQFEDADAGFAELALRRGAVRVSLPRQVISTVHKAKGLERESVLIVPCDRKHFADSDEKWRLLYVALSRATKSLALVLPNRFPSPLFRI